MIAGLGVAALIALALGAAALAPRAASAARDEIGELVAPGFEARSGEVALIMVTTSQESYHLVKDADGWVLTEKGRYPVRVERIGELVRAVSTIVYARPMTRDDRKFDRIELGDPAAGGTGALVEIGDGQGNAFAKLIVGYRDGRTYVREPDDLQAWAVEGGAMPPLQRSARWLDLDVASLAPEAIASVDVRLAGFAPYTLVAQDGAGSRFGLAPPYDTRRLIAALAPNLPALALTAFAPVDVAQAASLSQAVAAGEHVTRTREGLVVSVKLWRVGTEGWASVTATGPGAEAINARAGGWAFALTDAAWSTFATPLAAVVEPQ